MVAGSTFCHNFPGLRLTWVRPPTTSMGPYPLTLTLSLRKSLQELVNINFKMIYYSNCGCGV